MAQPLCRFLLLLLACLPLGGCAGALLVPAGMSALEASTMGFKALESGNAVWSRRTLGSDEPCTFEDALNATDRALDSLAFTRGITVVQDGTARVNCRDRGKDILIRLTRRTPRVTKIRIRVGAWGDQSLSLLLLNAIKLELSRDATEPGEGPEAETDPERDHTGPDTEPERDLLPAGGT